MKQGVLGGKKKGKSFNPESRSERRENVDLRKNRTSTRRAISKRSEKIWEGTSIAKREVRKGGKKQQKEAYGGEALFGATKLPSDGKKRNRR